MRKIHDKCSSVGCTGILLPQKPLGVYVVTGHTPVSHLSCNHCGLLYAVKPGTPSFEALREQQYNDPGGIRPFDHRPAPCTTCGGNEFGKEPVNVPDRTAPDPEKVPQIEKIGIYCLGCNIVRRILLPREVSAFDAEVAKVAEAIERNKGR
jgi:hypothetical protein